MNPSIPSSPQQDPSVTSLCCTLIKAVYLFGFFQAVQFLLVFSWGPSFPPTLKLGHSASAAKTPSFFSSSPPLGTAPSYTHAFPPQAHPGSVRAGRSGACCGLGWKCETLKTKPGKALTIGASPVLSRHGLCATQQKKDAQAEALKPYVGGLMNPAACGNGEVFTLFPREKAWSTST